MQLHQLLNVNQTIFYFSVYCVKISIVLFNRRLTALTSQCWNIAHWIFFSLVSFLMAFSVLVNIFVCVPVPTHYSLRAFASTDPSSIKCLDQSAVQLALRDLHIATDIALLFVPLIVLYKMKMPLRQKLRLGILFCFGLMTCVSSIMRNFVSQSSPSDFTCKNFFLTIEESHKAYVPKQSIYTTCTSGTLLI